MECTSGDDFLYPLDGALAVTGPPFELPDVGQWGGIIEVSQHVLDDLLVGTVLEIASLVGIWCVVVVVSMDESLEALYDSLLVVHLVEMVER